MNYNKAPPPPPPPLQKSVDGIVATLRLLVEAGMEELKVLQTILLLVTATDVVQGKSLSKVGHAPRQLSAI